MGEVAHRHPGGRAAAGDVHTCVAAPSRGRIHDPLRVILLATAVAGLLLAIWGSYFRPKSLAADVLRSAYQIPEGGGYCDLDDSGVAKEVIHRGVQILPASRSKNYFGAGFTFTVALNVARSKHLLDQCAPSDLQRAQREWYGATDQSGRRQLIIALEDLGLGCEVNPSEVRPGDFAIFSRRNTTHSVVFLGWVMYEDKKVGIRYRSAQKQTDGVGDAAEYFTTSGFPSGTARSESLLFARMTTR
jgi:hypothetical protein